jgi:hypothetical protein
MTTEASTLLKEVYSNCSFSTESKGSDEASVHRDNYSFLSPYYLWSTLRAPKTSRTSSVFPKSLSYIQEK